MRFVFLFSFFLNFLQLLAQDKIFIDNNKVINASIDNIKDSTLFFHTKRDSQKISLAKIFVTVSDSNKIINFYNKPKGLYALGKYDARKHHDSFMFFLITSAGISLSTLAFPKDTKNAAPYLLLPAGVCVGAFFLSSKINLTPHKSDIHHYEFYRYASEENYLSGYRFQAKKKNKRAVLFTSGMLVVGVGIIVAIIKSGGLGTGGGGTFDFGP